MPSHFHHHQVHQVLTSDDDKTATNFASFNETKGWKETNEARSRQKASKKLISIRVETRKTSTENKNILHTFTEASANRKDHIGW